MIEAKDFWNYLCEELNYRFFTGVPCMGLKPLYDKMNARIMHYVPAVKENTAVGLSSGTSLSDIKSGVLIDVNRIYNIMDWLVSFNIEYKVPLLIIAHSDEDCIKFNRILSLHKIPYRTLKNLKDLRFIVRKLEKLSVPGVIVIGEGVIKK